MAELDPNLKPEEHSYVNHYIHYADVLLNQDEDEDKERGPIQVPPDTDLGAEWMQKPPSRKVVEMPKKVEHPQSGKPKKEDGEVA